MAEEEFERPAAAPRASARDDLIRWRALGEQSVPRARTAAQTWRNGLAAFVTLLVSAFVVQAGDLVALPPGWRWATALTFVLGVAAAIAGLWQTLRAEAPGETSTSMAGIVAKHGSVAAYEQHLALAAQASIRTARRLVGASLVLIVFGVGIWSLAPATSPATVRIDVTWNENGDERRACGELLPADPHQLTVRAGNPSQTITVDVRQVVTLTPVGSCS